MKQVLSAHDLFTKLDGNVHAITSFASLFKNPNVLKSSLPGIYEMIKETDDCASRSSSLHIDENQHAQYKLKDARARRDRSYHLTTSVTINLLRETSEYQKSRVLDLFYFIGWFKTGLCKDALRFVWKDNV